MRLGRNIALAGAVVTLGLTAPPASATHYQCEGFNDPICNARYVNDHSVQPVRDTVDDVDRQVDQAVANALYPVVGDCGDYVCVAKNVLKIVNGVADPVRDEVDSVQQEVNETVSDATYPVLCGTFGAC